MDVAEQNRPAPKKTDAAANDEWGDVWVGLPVIRRGPDAVSLETHVRERSSFFGTDLSEKWTAFGQLTICRHLSVSSVAANPKARPSHRRWWAVTAC